MDKKSPIPVSVPGLQLDHSARSQPRGPKPVVVALDGSSVSRHHRSDVIARHQMLESTAI
jgi:hypothetical protein